MGLTQDTQRSTAIATTDDLLAKKSAHHRAYLEPYATGEPKIVAKLEEHRERGT